MTLPHTTADIALVMLGWCGLAVVFLLRQRSGPRPRGVSGGRRDALWIAGLLLQAVGFSMVWGVRRLPGTPVAGGGAAARIGVTTAIAMLVCVALALVAGAVRALGRHWSIRARLVQGHQLVTTGPYRFVRHPIYAGLLALLVATGLAFSTWPFIAAGFVCFAAGTRIRGASEERLLRASFGEEYDRYAARVPAVLPFPGLR